MKQKRSVLEGSITNHLIRLAIPSIGGMFAITIFNLTDTYFVSRLGTDALAAMGFTFPIVMMIGAISSGVSMGAGSILARAMGRGDTHKMQRIATDGILLSVLAVAIISAIGLLTMTPLFTLLGATASTLPLVKDYMLIWYMGVVVVVLPPVSDSCMRAMGDMVRPFLVMSVCAVFNVILDPILIFGYFGLPAMGIQGAALATIIARSLGMVLTLSFNHFHYRLLNFKYASIKELTKSWYEILSIGIPGSIVRLLPQIIRTFLTKIAATVAGVAGVAALAAGSRIESFSFIISMAIGVAIIPIIGQNYGAKHYERVQAVRHLISKTAIIYGMLLSAIALTLSEPIIGIFTTDPEVIQLTSTYLLFIFLGSAGLNLYNWLSEAFNAIGKPRISLYINVFGTLAIVIPFVLLGSWFFGFKGMVMGLALSQTILGIYTYYFSARTLTD